MLLAADVGGTKTNIALCALPEAPGAIPDAKHEATYASGDHENLEAIVDDFLRGLGPARPATIHAACFGVAGPVVDGCSETPNLPWVIRAESIAARFGIRRVELVNDLVATAIRVASFDLDDVAILHPAPPSISGPRRRVLVAAGTGLGVAQLFEHEGRFVPLASEGGHVCFAPRNAEEYALLEFLQRRYGRVSLERVVSGRGIANIYEYLLERGEPAANPDVARAVLADPEEAPRLVTENAESGRCPAARRAVELFVEAYGAAAGNFALTALATDGVFLGGGIAPKLLTALRNGRFLHAFFDKGRFRPLLENIGVFVIEDPETALIGAAIEAGRIANGQEGA